MSLSRRPERNGMGAKFVMCVVLAVAAAATALAAGEAPAGSAYATAGHVAGGPGESTQLRIDGRLAAAGVSNRRRLVVTAKVVRTIDTSKYSPPSPDPSGIVYVKATGTFIISDSEVNEMTIYHGKNLFTASRSRAQSGTGTGTSYPFSREPTGVGFNPVDNTLFISDDDRNAVFLVRPGADGVHGTSDDSVSSLSTSAFGSKDPEGVEYDAKSGHLFVADGAAAEVYDIDPVNGVFGDGNDLVTHFDVGRYGARGAEGIGRDAQRDTLLVIDPSTRSIYELKKGGALVRIINCRGVARGKGTNLAGVTMAPTSDRSDDPSRLNYWIVDRHVDNDPNPSENDGRLYEVSAPLR